MKKIKTLILVVKIFSVQIVVHGQTWSTFNSVKGDFSFKMPSAPQLKDTLDLVTYILPEDTTLSFQVNYVQNAQVSGNTEGLFSSGNTILPGGDTIQLVLEKYAQMAVYLTNGELTSAQNITVNSISQGVIRGKEISVRFTNYNGVYYLFTKYFYYNHRYLALTITGIESSLVNLVSKKNTFFSSLIIQ